MATYVPRSKIGSNLDDKRLGYTIYNGNGAPCHANYIADISSKQDRQVPLSSDSEKGEIERFFLHFVWPYVPAGCQNLSFRVRESNRPGVIGPGSTKMADTMAANSSCFFRRPFSRFKRVSVRPLNTDTRFSGICRPSLVIPCY